MSERMAAFDPSEQRILYDALQRQFETLDEFITEADENGEVISQDLREEKATLGTLMNELALTIIERTKR